MVKKHSNLLGESIHDTPDVGMDNEFWHEVLDLYFIRGRVSKGRQEDDLVFFAWTVKYMMLTKLNKQLSGEEWSWNNLNTLCWAIGSIAGSMMEEQENRFKLWLFVIC
ncbi:hypothetical protein Cni_G22593 [Canna indica]|uniref:Uncharacterized protein n=1 Tax=Canna indica TaxID=4628 RepID=A0AAQ3QLB3_9LILI|nr:hypothetical protein Cni_G22593 [Canna indica]